LPHEVGRLGELILLPQRNVPRIMHRRCGIRLPFERGY
jgi:hypothetical protein